jgi:hypothetical protein
MNNGSSFDVIDYSIAGVSAMGSWLDQHQGSAIVILTFALVCITAWYARRTSQMVKIIEQQTHINIEPVITIYPYNWIDIIDNKIKLEIRNEGTIDVKSIRLLPLTDMHWTIRINKLEQKYVFPLSKRKIDQIFEKSILKPEENFQIELDITPWTKIKRSDLKHGDFAFVLSYLREADHKAYEVQRRYFFGSKKVLIPLRRS